MAAKSDFAQKLLHDLRLRKERMAVTQNSSNSKLTSRGTHGNPGTRYKGSQQIKSLESVGPSSGSSVRKTSSSTRQLHIEDSSNQIVLYRKDRSSKHIGDLSTALAFAFGNGGRFNKMDASGNNQMLNFLHQIGRRSLDIGRMEIRTNMGKSSSTTQFPTFSHIHIHEISKGVQKLNQILRSCSNGHNFDRYSIDVGKELLKGAMDLEESLRMLVNVQKASDYMVNSQRKNKIKLLEEDEEDESEIVKVNDLKQLARPRFSFDKPHKNSSKCTMEAEHNGIKQQLLALTYPEETPRLQEKQPRGRSNSFSHESSASCAPDLKAFSTYLEPKGHSISHLKHEKERISNIVAKLMGLEELPPKEESNVTLKEMSSKKKEKTISVKIQIPAESRLQETGRKPAFTANKNVISASNSQTRDARFVLQAENIQAAANGSTQGNISDKNSHLQDFEVAARKDVEPSSKTALLMTNKKQNMMNQVTQHDEMLRYGRVLQEKEKLENYKANKEKNISKTGESKELVLNNVLQQKALERQRLSDGEAVSKKNTEVKRTEIQTGNSNASSIPMSKQQKHQDNLQQPQVLKKSDHLKDKRKPQLPKQALQAKKPKENQVESIVILKPKKRAKSSQKNQPPAILAPAAASKKQAMKHTEVKLSKDLSNSRPHEDFVIYTHIPQRKEKVNSTKIHKIQTLQKVNAAMNKRNETSYDLERSMSHQSPVREEKKQQKDEMLSSSKREEQEKCTESEEVKLDISGLEKSEVNTEPLNGEDLLLNGAEEVTFSNSGGKGCPSLEVTITQTCDDSSNELPTDIHEVSEDQGDKATLFSDGFKLKSQNALQSEHRGIREVSTEIRKIVYHEKKKIPPSRVAVLLTEFEKHLKEKLIKGQLFLNTAEALFKLNIPVSILHGNDHTGQDAETKMILDCGYELLKKKGRRQEFSLYPCKSISIGYVKVNSFDDLIKQLSKDFNMLKFYGWNGSQECDAADYLHKMLEKDIQYGHADVSCMWDFSWNEKTFAFLEKDDLVKDLEKHMLNGLLDEVTRDLLHIAVSA